MDLRTFEGHSVAGTLVEVEKMGVMMEKNAGHIAAAGDDAAE